MSSFVRIGDGRAFINLDQVAYIEDVTAWAVDPEQEPNVRVRLTVAFTAATVDPEDPESDPVPLSLSLENDDADELLAASRPFVVN